MSVRGLALGCALVSTLAPLPVFADTPLYFSGTYEEQFDSLPASPTNTNTNFPLWQDDGTLNGWFYVTARHVDPGGSQRFRASSGNSTTGSLYSYGTNNTSDRALGLHDSNTFTEDRTPDGTLIRNNEGDTGMWLALRLRNDTDQAFTSFTLTYDGEQWHQENTSPQKLDFSYMVNARGLKDPGFTDADALDFTSPIFGPVPTPNSATALDGNDPANRTPDITATISNIRWEPGQELYLRWIDVNDVARDHGLAIDNLRFSAEGLVPANTANWAVDADGTWSQSSNWSTAAAPDGPGARVGLAGRITSHRTVTLDSPRTVGVLFFQNASARYTLAATGDGSLRIEGAAGAPGEIRVHAGSHLITVPLTLAAGSEIYIDRNAGLGLLGPLTGRAERLTVNSNATLDLGINSLAVQSIDVPDPTVTTFAYVHRLIAAGRNFGAVPWNGVGINSSAAAEHPRRITGLAVIQNADADGNPLFTTFNDAPADADTVLIRYTYNGDSNLSGLIDAADYFAIDRGYSLRSLFSFTNLPRYRDGNFDYDADVDADDYTLIDRAFLAQSGPLSNSPLPHSPSSPSSSAVPEPTLLLLPLAALLIARRRLIPCIP